MAKEEETTEFSTEDFYAQFITAAKELVPITESSKGVQSISPEDMLKVIHNSIAFGLIVSGFHFMLDDKELFSLMVNEYRKMYENKISQFIPIQKNDKDNEE